MSFCELMTKPCEFAPPFSPVTPRKCDLCLAHYTIQELRKIKDELKLVKVRLGQDKENPGYFGWIEYGPKDSYPKIHYTRDPNHT